VVTGLDACKGAPCIGREGARVGYLQVAIGMKFFRKNSWWNVEGDRVTAHFESHPGVKWPRGAEHVRGTMTFTVRNGLITRIENSFRLDDPETIVIRNNFGDVIFGLRAPDTDEIVARVLVGWLTSASSAIVVQLVDPRANLHGLSAAVGEGVCGSRNTNARKLQFVGDVLETRIDIGLDRLALVPIYFELRRDGLPIACGNLPNPPPSE
jgi:hypothetical protein